MLSLPPHPYLYECFRSAVWLIIPFQEGGVKKYYLLGSCKYFTHKWMQYQIWEMWESCRGGWLIKHVNLSPSMFSLKDSTIRNWDVLITEIRIKPVRRLHTYCYSCWTGLPSSIKRVAVCTSQCILGVEVSLPFELTKWQAQLTQKKTRHYINKLSS